MSTPNEAIARKAAEEFVRAHWFPRADIYEVAAIAADLASVILASIEEAHKQGYSEGWHQACVMDLKDESRAAQPQELRDEQGRKVIVSSGD
jgi:hypothetical protein